MMASIQNIIIILAFVSLTLTFANGSSIPNFVFGKCQVGRDTCRDCYISLAQSLFQSDENVFNLSQAFFPPDTNTPEFVVVRYHFENESRHEEKVWFWGASASYFIYPLSTFQFLSLFFGKPEAYWTGEVDVTLNATECLGAKEEHLIMLTQRVSLLSKYHTFLSRYIARKFNNLGMKIRYYNWIMHHWYTPTRVDLVTNSLIYIQCACAAVNGWIESPSMKQE